MADWNEVPDEVDELQTELENGELEVADNTETQESALQTRNSIKANRESFSSMPLLASATSGPLSNFFNPDDVLSDHGSEENSGASSKATSVGSSNQEDEAEDGDDEFSGGSHKDLLEDQLLQNDLDTLKNDDQDVDEDEEEDIGEEPEEEHDGKDWRQRKKIYHFTKFKQGNLIVKYIQSVEKLKVVRKKNIYLQDRIYKHLREKERVLNQCHEAVKERKEMVYLQHLSSSNVKEFRQQNEDYDTQEVCDPVPTEGEETKIVDPISSSSSDLSYEALIASFKQQKKNRKKCKRTVAQKQGKGPSKTRRFAMKHYHLGTLISKKSKVDKLDDCAGDHQTGNKSLIEDPERDRSSMQEFKKSKSRRPTTYVRRQQGSDLNSESGDTHQQGEADIDELEDEWKYREKRRSKKIAKIREERKFLRKSLEPRRQQEKSTGPISSSRKSDRASKLLDAEHLKDYRDNQYHQDSSHQKNHNNQKRRCREKMQRQKSIISRKLLALEKVQALQANANINVQESQGEEDEKDSEEVLPEFKYEFSDLSLTKMKYGEKMRQELEKIVSDTNLPIHSQWPLTITGFKDYFQRKNPYGRVTYTLRLESQVKQAKKLSMKYKYVLHNYNYQIQQYNALKEIHEGNMKHLEITKPKWEFLVDDLLTRIVQEIRDYADLAVDSSGKKVPRDQIDLYCKEVGKEFENFQYTARIFYRVLLNVGIAIRHLCYSESHGEGVELFEFNHLVRTNETISTQYIQKRETLKSYKRSTKKFVNSYENQLKVKDDIELNVNDKFKLSGEISCMLGPKQDAVKSFEATAKKVLKQEAGLQKKAGIVPYPHLITDYEDTFMIIAEKRQIRRGFQLKYNSRVREVHQIFDKMEEIQIKVPELFMEPPPAAVRIDLCGNSTQNIFSRPQTAPPANRTYGKKQTPVTGASPSNTSSTGLRSSMYFSKNDSRNLLEESISRPKTAASFTPSRPKTSTSSLTTISRKISQDIEPPARSSTSRKSLSQKLSSVTLPTIQQNPATAEGRKSNARRLSFKLEDDPLHPRTNGSFSSIRPKTAAADSNRFSLIRDGQSISTDQKRLSAAEEKRPSTVGGKRVSIMEETKERLSTPNDNKRKSLYSIMIAGEHAEMNALAKLRTQQLMKPTPAKTGIVPKITKQTMLAITKGRHIASTNLQSRRGFYSNNSIRPSTVPTNIYESEQKHWPYQYYTKPSPELKNSSKKRMDIVLGSLVHQPRPLFLG